jgi:hypothetical protein
MINNRINNGIDEVQQSWLSFNESINKHVSYFKYKWGLLFTIHYSLFTIHYSLFTIHYSLFTIHYSLFTVLADVTLGTIS